MRPVQPSAVRRPLVYPKALLVVALSLLSVHPAMQTNIPQVPPGLESVFDATREYSPEPQSQEVLVVDEDRDMAYPPVTTDTAATYPPETSATSQLNAGPYRGEPNLPSRRKEARSGSCFGLQDLLRSQMNKRLA